MANPFSGLQDNINLMAGLNANYLSTIAQVNNSIGSLEALQAPLSKLFERDQKLFGETAVLLSNVKTICEMSSGIQNLSMANIGLSRLLESASVSDSSLSRLFAEQNEFKSSFERLVSSRTISDLLSHAEMTGLFRTSLESQVRLQNLESSVFGSRIDASVALSNNLSSTLGLFTQSYRNLLEHLPRSAESQIPFIATQAPIEYSRELDVLERISLEEVEQTAIDVLPIVDDEIHSFDQQLVALINGARESLRSENPDKARHVTTSVRELVTQILHGLAPDDELRKWSTDEEHFCNKRPTRRARLLYICRQFSCDPLSKFVEHDVQAALTLFDSLNSGTHVVASKLNDQQLEAIVFRAESLALFLLRVSRGG